MRRFDQQGRFPSVCLGPRNIESCRVPTSHILNHKIIENYISKGTNLTTIVDSEVNVFA